jgi:hypothetical protein
MRIDTFDLPLDTPGTRHSVTAWCFGTPGATPKAYVHAAMHADEVPAILVAQRLREQLEALEAQGAVTGEVVLVPFANPLGLSQQLLGHHHGRFDLRDGGNFNRAFPDLSRPLIAAVAGQLGADGARNAGIVRGTLRQLAARLEATSPAEALKHWLLQRAIDADVVLDLHCDTDAVMHLYALTPHRAIAQELGAALGARAVLLATDSGGSPFDEACTRPWQALQRALADRPVPSGCFAATVELRGECDTSHLLARQDADGLVAFLRIRGVLAGPAQPLPAPLCDPTPLAGSEPVVAPHAGVVVFHRSSGEQVAAGDTIADLVDPQTGATTPVRCVSAGLLYARCGSRWAHAGKRLGKIAGTTLARTGALLSP